MFIHQSRLKHVLPPEVYWTQQAYEQELEKLLWPAWHLVATRRELANDGDFVTVELMGKPLMIRNCEGELHAFLNVCAHRHCLLSTDRRGSSPRIRCPYHGWEYDKHGRTGKIPDAKAFAPFERERARLLKYRIDTCGDLIFVTLAEHGPTLQEFLGTSYASCQADFSHPWEEVWGWESEYPCNWKIPVENSLESYHMDCLHLNTFGRFPKEELCTHKFEDNLTRFHLDISGYKDNAMQRRVMHVLGGGKTDRYTHEHVFPNFLFTHSDTYSMLQSVVPISPTRAATVVRLFAFRGDRKNLLARIVAFLAKREGIKMTRKILLEDAGIFEAVQRGNENTIYTGVLGTREERVFAFQDWVARQCALSTPDFQPGDGEAAQLACNATGAESNGAASCSCEHEPALQSKS